MKLSYFFLLTTAVSIHHVAAFPNPVSQPGKENKIPQRFRVKSQQTINGLPTTTLEAINKTDLYIKDVPDDLEDWQWWCSDDRSYCDADWAPTVDESWALAEYLYDLDQECTIQREPGSKDDGYVVMVTDGWHAKVGGFFTHMGDTDRGYRAKYPCWRIGYILFYLIEACQCNGRVVGKTIAHFSEFFI